MITSGLIAALLIAVTLQSRWNQAAMAAKLEIASLQIAALETALESETTLSSASSEILAVSRRGLEISARALLYAPSSALSDSPVAVVIWSDSTQSGQIVFLADTALGTSFSSMSGFVSHSSPSGDVPLGFTSTRSSQIVSVQANHRIESPHKITIKILPRDGQGSIVQWIGEFQR